MKTVYSSNYDLIHAFAQRPNDPTFVGRSSGGSVYAEDGKLYSYGRHYVLAEWIDESAVLIDDRGYSVSTAKHIIITRSALSQYRQFFRPNIDPLSLRHKLEILAEKLRKARKPEKYIAEALYRIAAFKDYHEYTGKPYTLPDVAQAFGEDHVEQLRKFREAEAERIRNAAQSFQINFTTYEPFESFRKYVDFDLIRRMKDNPDTVETSQYVRIPYTTALEAFKRYQAQQLSNGQHVAGFTVHEMNPEYIRIGCHRFRIEDLNQFFGA